VGGVEHAILHLIYSRFWTKVMRDMGLIKNDEPATRLFTQGMVIKDGSKMSKSKGNVVSPDDMVERYGADATRMYALFAAPPDRDLDWQEDGVAGVSRFLGRVYRLVMRFGPVAVAAKGIAPEAPSGVSLELLRKLHQTIAKITQDFGGRWHFNTSIAAIMELINLLYAEESKISAAAMASVLEILTLMIAPFAPYLAQELWEEQGHAGAVFKHAWPAFDEELARESELEIPVQINGKNRAKIVVTPGLILDQLKELALADEKIKALIEGKTVVKVITVADKLVNIVVK
jgi:leucyl-tRNA synthetase